MQVKDCGVGRQELWLGGDRGACLLPAASPNEGIHTSSGVQILLFMYR